MDGAAIMLAYLLALVVGLGSFALYMAAFFFPEVHRKNDFIWSGLGLFYALVLWVFAERLRGGLLLGQAASVAMLGWFGWQMLLLRRQVAPVDEQTAVPNPEELKGILADLSKPEIYSDLSGQVTSQFTKLQNWIQGLSGGASKAEAEFKLKDDRPYVPLTPEDFASARRNRLQEATVEAKNQETVLKFEDEIAEDSDFLDVTFNEIQPSQDVVNDIQVIVEQTAERANEQEENIPQSVDLAANEAAREVKKVIKSMSQREEQPVSQLKEKSTGIFGTLTDVAKGFFKKKESKPTYVRKQFRPSSQEGAATEVVSEVAAVAASGLVAEAIATTEEKPDILEAFIEEKVEEKPEVVIPEDGASSGENLFQEDLFQTDSETIQEEGLDLANLDLSAAFPEEAIVETPEETITQDSPQDFSQILSTDVQQDLEALEFDSEATIAGITDESLETPISESLAADIDAFFEGQAGVTPALEIESSPLLEDVPTEVESLFAESVESSTDIDLNFPSDVVETESSPEIDSLLQDQFEEISEDSLEIPLESVDAISFAETPLPSEDVEELLDLDLEAAIETGATDFQVNTLFQEDESSTEASSEVFAIGDELGSIETNSIEANPEVFAIEDELGSIETNSLTGEVAPPAMDFLFQEESEIVSEINPDLSLETVEESVLEVDNLFQEEPDVATDVASELAPEIDNTASSDIDFLLEEPSESTTDSDLDISLDFAEPEALEAESLFQESEPASEESLTDISFDLEEAAIAEDLTFQEQPEVAPESPDSLEISFGEEEDEQISADSLLFQESPETTFDFNLETSPEALEEISPEMNALLEEQFELPQETTDAALDISPNSETELVTGENELLSEPFATETDPDLGISFETKQTDLAEVDSLFQESEATEEDIGISFEANELFSPEPIGDIAEFSGVDSLLQESEATEADLGISFELDEINSPESPENTAELSDVSSLFQESEVTEEDLGISFDGLESDLSEFAEDVTGTSEMDSLLEESATQADMGISFEADDSASAEITEGPVDFPEVDSLFQEPEATEEDLRISFDGLESDLSEFAVDATDASEVNSLLEEFATQADMGISFEADDSASAEITEGPVDFPEVDSLFQEPEATEDLGISFDSEETDLSGVDSLLQEPEATEKDLGISFDSGEPDSTEIGSLFQESEPALPQEFVVEQTPEETVSEENLDITFEEDEDAFAGVDSLFQESSDDLESSDLGFSLNGINGSGEVSLLFDEQSIEPPVVDLEPASDSQINVDSLLQEQPEEIPDLSLESSTSFEPGLETVFQEQEESSADLNLENPFVEAIAEQPVLTENELLDGAEAPLDLDYAGMFAARTASETTAQTEEIEFEFEPEGTIDLNNLEGLFDDEPMSESIQEVEELFPDDSSDISLEAAFKDSDSKNDWEKG